MTVLDQSFLQVNLPAILGVDAQFVIPRQANWFNVKDNLPMPGKPMTWCAFALEDERPLDLPHYIVERDALGVPVANWSVQHNTATLALQFVGTRGKEMATSVGHWLHRSDVFDMFSKVDGSVLGDFRVTAVDFVQEGLNTVKAYTARLRILYASEIETGQGPMPVLKFQGTVT